MEIVRVGSRPSEKGATGGFAGTVRIDPLFRLYAPERVQGGHVTFSRGRVQR